MPPLATLPDALWQARPALAHIRQAAHARNRSADAALHAVLARVAAMAPPELRVDTGVGSPACLPYYAALIGPSGAGKSGAVGVARDLVVMPDAMADDGQPRYLDDAPLGSGEGIAEAYMGTVQREEGNPQTGRSRIVSERRRVRSHVMIYADEGEALGRMLERAGATIGETLRRAWVGETIGQRNGSSERTRIVARGSYSLGLVIGYQMETAAPLLADAAAGTPQRFAYASAVDGSIPDDPPRWPGPLKVTYPGDTDDDGMTRIPVDPVILREIRAADLARVRGQEVPALLDAHEPLTLVKTSALLAILDGRYSITVEDWALARVIWDTSCAVRDAVAEYSHRQATRAELARTAAVVRRQRALDDDVDERAMAAAMRSVAGRVRRHAATHDDGCCTRRCITNALPGRVRGLVSLDHVIERLIGAYLITAPTTDRYQPGRRSA